MPGFFLPFGHIRFFCASTCKQNYLQFLRNRITYPDAHLEMISMETNALSFEVTENQIDAVVARVQNFYQVETGKRFSRPVVSDSVRTWLERRFDSLMEEVEEVLTSPDRNEAHEFRRILNAAVEKGEVAVPLVVSQAVQAIATESVFTGFRKFSPEKLGAMIAYFAENGKEIYKTKLNKLLFYTDLTNFFKFGYGISGAAYLRLPYGPVPDNFEGILKECQDSHTIRIEKKVGYETNTFLIREDKNTAGTKDILSPEEIETLDWVLDNYGEMTTAEIVELSHREKAYRFTRPSEEIAYEYAKFFEKLPAKPGKK
jgi:hypothetical protein